MTFRKKEQTPRMRDSLYFFKETLTPNNSGGQTSEWTLDKKVKGSVQHTSGDENSQYEMVQTRQQISVTIRPGYRPTTRHRLDYNGERFNVTWVDTSNALYTVISAVSGVAL